MTIAGCDVSNHQATVDWAAMAAAGMSFGIAKASEGVAFRDAYFERNWQGMAANGLVRGAYDFARPGYGHSPRAEADVFLSMVYGAGGLDTGDLLVLDAEDTSLPPGSMDFAAWHLEWLEFVKAETGVTPWLYSGCWFLIPYGLTVPALARFPLWLADYGWYPAGYWPHAPAPWSEVTCWQYTSEGTAGGEHPLDLNRFAGTVEELRALGFGGAEDGMDQATKDQIYVYLDEINNQAGVILATDIQDAAGREECVTNITDRTELIRKAVETG